MATRRTIKIPEVRQYFRRIPQPANPFSPQLEGLLLAPWYQIQRAFSDTEPLASARVSLFGEDGGSATDTYNEGYYSPEPRYAHLPGVQAGATVDTDWSSFTAVTGSGAGRRSYVLNAPEDEVEVLVRETGVVLGECGSGAGTAGTGYRTCQFPGVDFNLVLADYLGDLPGTTLPLSRANSLSDTVLYIETDLFPGRRMRVREVDPSAPDTLFVEDDIFVDAIGPADAPNDGASLYARPGEYTWYASGNKASRPIAGHTLAQSSNAGDEVCTTVAGTTRCYNFDTLNAWTVTFALGGADSSPSVAVTYTPATNSGTVAVTFGADGGGLFDNTDAAKSGVATINALIRDAFKPLSRAGEVPIQFYPQNSNFESAQPDDHAAPGSEDGVIDPIAAAVRDWSGYVRSKAAGDEGNAYKVTVQIGTAAEPTVETPSTGHWVINLGTTPTNNTIDFINTKLVDAGDLIEIVGSTPATDELDVFSLGEARDQAGYTANAWFANSQSYFLEGGVDAGGVKFAGGLVPNFDVASPTLSSFSIYSEYRALRVDKSANASLTLTGNRPDVTFVTPDNYEDVVGEVDADNPMGLACSEYFAASEGRRVAIMSVGATSSDTPWGTMAATRTALEFLQRRDVYHIYVFNDDDAVYATVDDWATSLGGTEDVPLKRPQRFYVPTKNFSARPDITTVTGDSATDVDAGTGTEEDLILDIDSTAPGLFDATKLSAGKYVLVFDLDTDNDKGTHIFADGSKGYVLKDTGVGGNPYRARFEVTGGEFPGSGTHTGYSIIEIGESLYDSAGVYKSQEAADALYDFHDFTRQRRLHKHHCDSYEGLVGGSFVSLDGVFLMAQFAGLIAKHPDHLPVTSLTYPRARGVRGTTDTYMDTATSNQLELLMGAGLILPAQRGGSDSGPVYVMRDLSTNVDTRVSRRRTAGVSEDKLSIELDRLIQPRLGPALVTEQFLDRVSFDVDALLQNKMNPGASREFKTIRLQTLLPITDEVRAEFGIDDSGIMLEISYTHLDEAAQAIIRHVVRPS
jgi:hypothetical protein